MQLRSVRTRGFAGLAEQELLLRRSERVSGPLRARRALADALLLAFGVLDPLAAARALGWLGVAAQEDEGCWHVSEPHRLRGLLAPGPTRTLKVRLELELDPPQFGELRQQAVHDPDLVDSLGEAVLVLSCGWAFTRDLSVATPSLLSAKLGGRPMDLGRDWLGPWLAKLAGRLGAHTPGAPDPAVWAAADRNPVPDRRRAWERAVKALQGPPFSFGAVRVVESQGQDWLVLGPDMLPLSRLGPVAQNAVALVQAVFLEPAEILVVEEAGALTPRPRALLNWLERQAESPDSPLEQVLMLGPGGGPSVSVPGPEAESALTL